MSRRLLLGLLGAVLAYVVVTVAAYFLVSAFSTNAHDRALEAAMSSAFFYGPIGAVAGFALGWRQGGEAGDRPPDARV